MLKMIYNVELKPNTIYIKDNNCFNFSKESYLSEFILDQLKKSFLTQKREFINIETEEKKKDDKNITCSHFVINNLLSLFNETNKYFNIDQSNNTKNKNIQKKKVEKNKNILPDNFRFFEKMTMYTIKKNQKKNHILNSKILSTTLKKNKNLFNQLKKFISEDTKNNYISTKLHHHDYHKKINFFQTNQDNIEIFTKQKHPMFFKDFKSDKGSVFSLKHVNQINSVLRNENILKDTNQKRNITCNTKTLFYENSDNSIEWKKLVSQKILLSIANKKNEAEIYLKPESLGSIYIKIHMKDDQASFNFFSSQNEVRRFLNNYIPFLQDALKKNGIRLSKVSISNSHEKSIVKNSQNNFNLETLTKRFKTHKKNIENSRYAFIDLYI